MGCEKSSGATRRPKEFYGEGRRSKNLVKIHGMDFFPQGKKYNGIIHWCGTPNVFCYSLGTTYTILGIYILGVGILCVKWYYGICTLYVLLYIYTMYVKELDVLVCIWLKLFAKLSARIVAFIPLPKKW